MAEATRGGGGGEARWAHRSGVEAQREHVRRVQLGGARSLRTEEEVRVRVRGYLGLTRDRATWGVRLLGVAAKVNPRAAGRCARPAVGAEEGLTPTLEQRREREGVGLPRGVPLPGVATRYGEALMASVLDAALQ